jgi:Aromatic-ring-opening dioxygenase LigAB, LigA subunit
MAYTTALGQLVQQLHTDTTLQNAFAANPSAVAGDFDLTSHEHDAVVTRDCNDLVALGVANSISALPDVMCPDRAPTTGPGSVIDRLRRELGSRLPSIFDRIPRPRPPGPRPRPPEPGPFPGPNPQPRPGPTPGPDPPGPDI